MSIARADGWSRLAWPLAVSTLGHAAVVAALLFVRPVGAEALPPMYHVNLVAAPAGARAEGVVVTPTATAAAASARAHTAARARSTPQAMPMPTAKTRVHARSSGDADSHANRDRRRRPWPSSGGGPTGDRGTDVATVRTEGVDFPYPATSRTLCAR